MAAATDILQIVNATENSLSAQTKALQQLFGTMDENTPIIVVSAIGNRDTGKSMLLDFLLAFLKGGCNHLWSRNGETKLEGFPFGVNRKHRCTINACLVRIEFDGDKVAVLLLDAENGENEEAFSAMNSKLQMICTALSSTLIYVKSYSNDKQVEPIITSLMKRYTQYIKTNAPEKSSLLTVLMNSPDHVLPDDCEEAKFKTGSLPTIPDNVATSLKSNFEECFTFLLPKCCESFPDNFQGELKYLNKNFKDYLKLFLMGSFSLFNLLGIKEAGKCYKNKNEFLQRLKSLVEVTGGKGIENIPCQELKQKAVAEKPMKSWSQALPAGAKAITSVGIKAEENDNDIEQRIITIESSLKKSMVFLAENVEKRTPELLEEVHSKFVNALKVLEDFRGKYTEKKGGSSYKKLPFTLEDKIKVFTIEKDRILQLSELQTVINVKLAEQLYYPVKDFDDWIRNTRSMAMNIAGASTKIPKWFEPYLDILLKQAGFLNDEIRETERTAVDEAISIALGFYETKMKVHVENFFFKESELEKMNIQTLEIVQQSLEYGTKLENRRNIALDDFEAMQTIKQQAKLILDSLKTGFMQNHYTSVVENSDKAATKAFKAYQNQLEGNIRDIDQLKVTKLYEFHLKAKDNALDIFYKELTSLPKELIEPFAKNLSEDIEAEHKRIRNVKVNDSESKAAASSILGIQFGLAEIKFGIYKEGNPKLFKISNNPGIPNFINLSEDISVGSEAKEIYTNQKSGFKMEEVLLNKVGTIYEELVMGNAKSLQQEVIVSLVFGYIKSTASKYFNEEIYRCVISVPNAFDYVQRKMIKDSAGLTGFEVLQILSENAAAAVTFRFAPEYHYNTKESVNLLVHSYISESENDASSVFKVKAQGITMLSSCSPPFVKEIRNSGYISSVVNFFRGYPAEESDIIIADATQKSKVENACCMLVKSGRCCKRFTPDMNKVKKFCNNVSSSIFSNAVVTGTIYCAEAIQSGKQFDVTEALQYGVSIEFQNRSRKLKIERNTPLPTTMELNSFVESRRDTPICANLAKLQGNKIPLGSYSIDARHKSKDYSNGQILFKFDSSGLLTTKGFILYAEGKEEIFVTEQTDNMNEHRKREISEQLKQIYNLQKDVSSQNNVRIELRDEYKRIKGLFAQKSLPQTFKNALKRTFDMCQDVIDDKTSNAELLKQQLECLRKAKETFL